MERSASGAEATRQSLIDAALMLFGEKGYEAVSTREIADQAGANIGSISYHFGGKPGLRLACAQFVMEKISGLVAPIVSMPVSALSPEQAQGMMEGGIEQFGRFVVSSPQARFYAAFIIREVMQPGEVMEHIYDHLFGPVHKRLCVLFGLATGREAEDKEVKIAIFSFFGQILYFRVARSIVLKRMNWSDIGEKEADVIVSVIKTNLRGLIAAHRKE